MAYEGMTVLELVDQAVQQCQKTEADADGAVAVAARMASETQQMTAEFESVSNDTLSKLEVLKGNLEKTEQDLEALENNRNELSDLNQQVDEVAARVESMADEITSELEEILKRVLDLVPALEDSAVEIQEEVVALAQISQDQAGQIRQKEAATLIRGTELQVQASEALGEMGELQRELDRRLSDLGEILSGGQKEFMGSFNELLEQIQEKLVQLTEVAEGEFETLGSELRDSMLIETNQALAASFQNFLEKLNEFLQVGQETFNEIDSELGSILNKFADSIESLKLISNILVF